MGEAVFGWDQQGDDYQHDPHNGVGFEFCYGPDAPTYDGTGQLDGETFATWPDTLPAADGACFLLSIYGTTSASHVLTKLTAYLNADDMMGFDVDFAAAIYDADSRALLASSDAVTVSPNGDVGQWVQFDIDEGPTLAYGERYILMLWCGGLDGLGTVYADNVAEWVAPEPGPAEAVEITVRDVVQAAEPGAKLEHQIALTDEVLASEQEPAGASFEQMHFISVIDVVQVAEPDRPTLVSPCFGRYIDLETMLGLPRAR